jgi:hypothetical protein
MPAVAETYQVKRLLSDLLALSKVKAIILSGRYATRLVRSDPRVWVEAPCSWLRHSERPSGPLLSPHRK